VGTPDADGKKYDGDHVGAMVPPPSTLKVRR
jgi:hypothetical protein